MKGIFLSRSFLHGRIVESQLGIHAFQAGVLYFKSFGPTQLRGVHPSVLGFLGVVDRGADAGLAADILDRDTGVGLFED